MTPSMGAMDAETIEALREESRALENKIASLKSGKLWIVGRSFWILEPAPADYWHWTWDFHGVFSDEAKAAALCKDEHWFIIPVEIDEPLPEEPYQFCRMVVPNRTKAEPLRHKRVKA